MSNLSNRIYELNDKPPIGKAVTLGLQHVLAMFVFTIKLELFHGLPGKS